MDVEVALRQKLKEVFGYNEFRGNQLPVIKNIMSGQNTFVIMPTGAGKSLCYQLPALLQEGTVIVISPLIALMKNQVDQLQAFGVNAQFMNSSLTKAEIVKVKEETIAGKVKLLYVAPESLTKESNIEFLKKANISFVAIDEAHCISEWGHDFRPEYRRIKRIISEIGEISIIALTATATPKVQLDVIKNLQMEGADLFKSSFNRDNLYYEVRPKQQAKKHLIKYVKTHKGKSGIIYCLSRKKVEEIADLLNVNDVKALPYHAGLDNPIRVANQEAFLNEDVDVIVATIAFGMGIDKPDVRFVIHYDTPKSLEGYYQETGRAGRDGLEGNCLLFYSYNDILKLEKFNKDKPVTERDNARVLLQEMADYAESSVCRRKQLLHYFGEVYPEDCGFCNNCKHPKEKFEGKDEILKVLQTVNLTEQRFGFSHLVNVINGVKNQYVTNYGHDKLPVFNTGNGENDEFWKSMVRQAALQGFLLKDIENVGVFKLSDTGNAFLSKPVSVIVSRDHDYDNLGEEEEPEKDILPAKEYDKNLFKVLKGVRKKVAEAKGLPPYVIFQDPSLEEMAILYPTSKEELAHINGVGQGKIMKFGASFLAAIKEYVEENDIAHASDIMVKSMPSKSKNKIYIIQQIDRKRPLDEIAQIKKMTMPDLVEEIEHICYAGTKLDINYYIDSVLDEERQDDIIEYFLAAESDNIGLALDEWEDEGYAEEDLRLMRIKFLSDYAN